MGITYQVCDFCGEEYCSGELKYCEKIKYEDKVKSFDNDEYICDDCLEKNNYTYDDGLLTISEPIFYLHRIITNTRKIKKDFNKIKSNN